MGWLWDLWGNEIVRLALLFCAGVLVAYVVTGLLDRLFAKTACGRDPLGRVVYHDHYCSQCRKARDHLFDSPCTRASFENYLAARCDKGRQLALEWANQNNQLANRWQNAIRSVPTDKLEGSDD